MDLRDGDRHDVDGDRAGPCRDLSAGASFACWLYRSATGDHLALGSPAICLKPKRHPSGLTQLKV